MFKHIIIVFMPTRWPKPLYMYVGNRTEISELQHQEGRPSFMQSTVFDCLLVPGIGNLREKRRCKHIRP